MDSSGTTDKGGTYTSDQWYPQGWVSNEYPVPVYRPSVEDKKIQNKIHNRQIIQERRVALVQESRKQVHLESKHPGKQSRYIIRKTPIDL
jgi:hypothetical protein